MKMGLTEFFALILIGLIAGIFGGMFGLGGGVVVIPALVMYMGFSQHQAQGTNLAFMLAPIGLLAVMNYYKDGYVNIKYAVILAFAFFIGAYLGSLWSVQIPDNILKKVFGGVVIIIGLKMILGK